MAAAVFVWHHYRFELVPWTTVATAADADALATTIESRLPINVDAAFPDAGKSRISGD